MSELNIPLSEYFLEIIRNYEIYDWEAKQFWLIIRHFDSSNLKALREDMYAAIKILSKKGYLVAKKSPFNKNVYLYSESQKIKELRDWLIKGEVKNPLIIKRNSIIKELEIFKREIEFVDQLMVSYPEFDDQIKRYRKKVNYEIENCEIKIRVIDNIIKGDYRADLAYNFPI